jgi:hypothetical protein
LIDGTQVNNKDKKMSRKILRVENKKNKDRDSCWPCAHLVLSWCWPGTVLVLAWYCPGAGLVLAWCWPGAGLVLAWCWPGTDQSMYVPKFDKFTGV